jgi:histidinol phosphatase-like PHP family hydrolase
MLLQDLHIHTVFSRNDPAIVPEQTIELISKIRHASIIGISDHIEHMTREIFDEYEKVIRQYGFLVGAEIDGPKSIDFAIDVDPDYFVYHCYDSNEAYQGVYQLLDTGKPLIIAHPLIMKTNLNKLPTDCFIEISNRYVWKSDWRNQFSPFLNRFRFVFSSDAHQPVMLNQTVAKYVGDQLGIQQSVVFANKFISTQQAI